MTISPDTVVPTGTDHHAVTFAELLDRLAFSGLSEQEQGRRFERLAKRFLEVEPKYADQYSDVWLWNEWPGRDGKPDTGVDIVAKDRYTGELTGIQAKFYPPDKKLQKGQIDSFFTQLGKVDFAQGMVVNTSIEWSKHAVSIDSGWSGTGWQDGCWPFHPMDVTHKHADLRVSFVGLVCS